MTFLLQHRIYRSDLRNNPSVLYLFGDNEARSGLRSQAKECRGEPNAVGIATKKKPSRTEQSYWTDEEFERCKKILKDDFRRAFEHLRSGGIDVCPSDGLGTGLSELPTRAPRIHKEVQDLILECQEISKAG